MSIEKSPESSSHTFRFLIGSRNVLYSPIASTGAPIGRITGSAPVDHSHWLECKQTGDRRVFQSQSTQQCGRIVSQFPRFLDLLHCYDGFNNICILLTVIIGLLQKNWDTKN